ncbi:MAG: IS256 family transposase [Chloroflexi bacterium]|nr:IS256 family transposase [Chloroflexota bacterium]
MGKQTTNGERPSTVVWDNLEEWVRREVQGFIQSLLEEEVTELLGREKSERRQAVDSLPIYRNGHGKARRVTLGCGTITVHRPRVRGLEQRFESRVLPMFARRTAEINKLIPQLYLHGLALGDFDLALRGLLGEAAPISASTVAHLKDGWQAEREEWKKRPLDGMEVLFMWVDGVYVKAGLEKDKAVLLVMVGGLADGRKVILAVEPGYRESTESCSGVLRDLRERGMNCPRLVAGDGNLGIWGALSNVYPDAAESRCCRDWNHKIVKVLDKLPKKVQPQAKRRLQDIACAESQPQAEQKRDLFSAWCRKEGQRAAGDTLVRGWERMVTFYQFPKEHWKHLRTTNVVESPFAALRLRTDAAKRYRKVENATAVIWKMLMLAERRFRRLDAPEKLMQVYLGFGLEEAHDGTETEREEVLAVARHFHTY